MVTAGDFRNGLTFDDEGNVFQTVSYTHLDVYKRQQWAGSSWYFLRYCDPHNKEQLASKEALEYWMPVDWYNGGMEHTTLHLLYSRFWHKFLYDIGVVPTKEPYRKRTSHGMILGENGEKMSKSRGNVVNPDDIIAEYGADTMRLYEMFLGDFEKAAPWSSASIKGCRRFLDKCWSLLDKPMQGEGYHPQLESAFHKAVKKVGEDIEVLKCNTAIATLMSLVNDLSGCESVTKDEMSTLIRLLSPFAPHIAEEMWEKIGGEGLCCKQAWPTYDEAKCVDDAVEIAVTVGGKVRGRLQVTADMTEDDVVALALKDARISEAVGSGTVVKKIYVPMKILNLVIKP